jgi:hypothetical protein
VGKDESEKRRGIQEALSRLDEGSLRLCYSGSIIKDEAYRRRY